MSEPTPPTPGNHAAGFIPRCVECRYDLSDIPDGRCPECGHAFTFDALRTAHFQRRPFNRRAVALTGMWTLVWFIAAVFLKTLLGDTHTGLVIFAWIWMSMAWVFRLELGCFPLVAFLLIFAPAAVCMCIASDTEPTSANPHGFQFLPILLLACLTAVTLAWATVGARRLVAALAAWSGALSAVGIVVTLISATSACAGRTWSVWPDIRWWQPYSNYPFTNGEAVLLGCGLTILGIMLLLVPKLLGWVSPGHRPKRDP